MIRTVACLFQSARGRSWHQRGARNILLRCLTCRSYIKLAVWAERHLAAARPGEPDDPWPVLLLDVSLVLDGRDAAAWLDVTPGSGAGADPDADARWTLREAQEARLLPLGEAVVASGVRLVMAQRLVHDWLKRWLLLRRARRRARLGAAPLRGADAGRGPHAERAARLACSRVGAARRGGRAAARLAAPGRRGTPFPVPRWAARIERPAALHAVLCGCDQLACERILKLLRAFAQEPVVLAGRGAVPPADQAPHARLGGRGARLRCAGARSPVTTQVLDG